MLLLFIVIAAAVAVGVYAPELIFWPLGIGVGLIILFLVLAAVLAAVVYLLEAIGNIIDKLISSTVGDLIGKLINGIANSVRAILRPIIRPITRRLPWNRPSLEVRQIDQSHWCELRPDGTYHVFEGNPFYKGGRDIGLTFDNFEDAEKQIAWENSIEHNSMLEEELERLRAFRLAIWITDGTATLKSLDDATRPL